MAHRASGRAIRAATLAIASGGLLFGHWLVYLIMSPNATDRESLLAGSGHAYLGAADRLALIATLAGLAVAFLGRVTGAEPADPSPRSIAARLAGFQVSAFIALEVAERLSAGSPVGALAHSWILPAGTAIQLAVGALGAWAIGLVLLIADGTEALVAGSPTMPLAARPTSIDFPLLGPAAVAVPVAGGRGPPSPR
jgi:hypothetical protein